MKRHTLTPAVLIMSLCLGAACKAVRGGKPDDIPDAASVLENTADQAPADTIAPPHAGSALMPDLPQTTTPVKDAQASPPSAIYLLDPAPAETPAKLTKPERLQSFTLRTIDLTQSSAKARQIRVDLPSRRVKLDTLNKDAWEQSSEYTMTDDQLTQVRSIVLTLSGSSFPSCEPCKPCKRESRLLLIEGLEDNKKALSYAMNETCSFGANGGQKSTVSYPALKRMTDLLDR